MTEAKRLQTDINCPVELIHIDQIPHPDHHRTARMTFINESERTITGVEGDLLLLDVGGTELASRPVAFSNLSAKPDLRFVCNMPSEGFPLFDDARILVKRVVFAEGEPWVFEEGVDCAPPLVIASERAALAAIGEDAICFPEQRGDLWVCACGRFNRMEWENCRRCRRSRDVCLHHFTRESAHAAIDLREQADDADKRLKEEEENRARRHRGRAIRRKHRRRKRMLKRAALGVGMAVLLACAVLGGYELLRSSSASAPSPSTVPRAEAVASPTPNPTPDYLDPIG